MSSPVAVALPDDWDSPGATAESEPPRALTVRERLVPPMPADGWAGWIGPLVLTAIAAVLRFVNLGEPKVFSFDETYYAKDAWSLLRYHYEQLSVEGADAKILGGNFDVFTGHAANVVHPPVGKWIIGIGEQIFGFTPFGWRFMPALLGTLAVLMFARIVRRITRSNLLGCIAGLLLTLDGLAIVLSRTALLDGILMFFVLGAFGALVIDRDRSRARLADWAESRDGDSAPDARPSPGPRLGLRPWRLTAGLLLGLACSTKWSGIYFLATFAVMTVLWDAGARKTAGVRRPYTSMLRRDSVPAFLSLVPVTFAVYALSWVPWLLSYNRQQRFSDAWTLEPWGPSFLGTPIRALLNYHAQMWHFHNNLTSGHSYQGRPAGWLLQVRPTAFWSTTLTQGQDGCVYNGCTREVTSIGTPIIWWAATAALVWLIWRWAAGRDWRAGAALAGVAAGWLPWLLLYNQRTIFTFYEIVFAPFMFLGLTLALGAIIGPATASATRRTWGTAAVGGYLLLAVANTAWLWPILVGDLMSSADWLRRMWFKGWI